MTQNKLIGINYLNEIPDEVVIILKYPDYPICYSLDNLVYVPILKNAHTSLNLFFKEYGFKKKYKNSTLIPDTKKCIIILRDPIERWKSGLLENLAYKSHITTNISDEILTRAVNYPFVDPHTLGQTFFLKNLCFEQCVFFKLDTNLEINLNNYLSKYYGANHYKLEKIRDANFDPFKLKIKPYIENFLDNNPEYMTKLKNIYKLDYILIDDVKKSTGFYEAS